jgi:cytochrome c-type biogenesis protein CcmH
MTERILSVLRISAAAVAVVVIVVGLWPRSEVAVEPEARADAIAANIKCPFCSGESLFDSTSGVARDYRSLIDELIEDGRTDDEIYDAFVTRFGESILLDPSGSGWGVLLWVVPALVAVIGVGAVIGLRRRAVATGRDHASLGAP